MCCCCLSAAAASWSRKQRIFEEVWDGVFVTDAALTQCIKDIRKQLGDDASSPRYIKTVPKHGYIFIGNVVDAERSRCRSRAQLRELPQASARTPTIARPYKFLDYTPNRTRVCSSAANLRSRRSVRRFLRIVPSSCMADRASARARSCARPDAKAQGPGASRVCDSEFH